jgi:hypothetical protein
VPIKKTRFKRFDGPQEKAAESERDRISQMIMLDIKAIVGGAQEGTTPLLVIRGTRVHLHKR